MLWCRLRRYSRFLVAMGRLSCSRSLRNTLRLFCARLGPLTPVVEDLERRDGYSMSLDSPAALAYLVDLGEDLGSVT